MYVYGAVPPMLFPYVGDVKVSTWPRSIFAYDTKGTGGVSRTLLTVMVFDTELKTNGVVVPVSVAIML